MLDLPLPLPVPHNEPILNYAPGSPEKAQLKAALKAMAGERPDIPHVIGGKEHRDGAAYEVRAPHNKSQLLATAHDGAVDELLALLCDHPGARCRPMTALLARHLEEAPA